MTFRYLIAATAALIVAAPAVAQDVAAPAAASTAKPAKAKKICRSAVATGSIMQRSVCMTAEEWAHQHEADARGVDAMRNLKSGLDTHASQ